MKELLEPVRILLRQGRTLAAREALDTVRASAKIPLTEEWQIGRAHV